MDELRQRRDWFEENLKGVEIEIFGIKDKVDFYTCPCCGYPTLGGKKGNLLCEICYWVDDDLDYEDVDKVISASNCDYSLAEARQNFKKTQSVYLPDDDDPLYIASEQRNLYKNDLMNFYDSFVSSDVKDFPEMWKKANSLKRKLVVAFRNDWDEWVAKNTHETKKENFLELSSYFSFGVFFLLINTVVSSIKYTFPVKPGVMYDYSMIGGPFGGFDYVHLLFLAMYLYVIYVFFRVKTIYYTWLIIAFLITEVLYEFSYMAFHTGNMTLGNLLYLRIPVLISEVFIFVMLRVFVSKLSKEPALT